MFAKSPAVFAESPTVSRFLRVLGLSQFHRKNRLGRGVPWFVAPAPYICLSRSRHLVPGAMHCAAGGRVHSWTGSQRPATIFTDAAAGDDDNGSRAAPVAPHSTARLYRSSGSVHLSSAGPAVCVGLLRDRNPPMRPDPSNLPTLQRPYLRSCFPRFCFLLLDSPFGGLRRS